MTLFPLELLALILGYLSGDLPTLKHCALVSRRFNSISRRALFHRIRVRSEAEVLSLANTLQADPEIGDNIRELAVVDNTGTHNELLSVSLHLPHLLPKLRSIELSEFYRTPQTPPAQLHDSLAAFTNIEEVSFFCYSFTLPFVFASALPSLKHLDIRCYGATPRAPPPDMPPAPPTLHLSSFSFHGSLSTPADSAFSWILSTGCRHSLRSVKLFVPFPRAEVYGAFLRELGPILEYLDLAFPPSVNMTASSPHINLEESTGLRALIIRNVPSPFLHVLLSTIPSVSMKSVTLFIPSFSGEDFRDYVEMQSLSQIDGHHFWGLEELVFVYRGDPEDRLVTQQRVEGIYQRYHKAGVLKIIDVPEFDARTASKARGFNCPAL